MSKKLIALGIVVLIILIIAGVVWSSYNGLVSKDEGVKASWADVEAQYQRRVDLIPNLVSTVEGVITFEKETQTKIAEIRTQAAALKSEISTASDASELESTSGKVDNLIAGFRALNINVENYPDLKSSQNFLALQDELAGTENRVAVVRTRYNDAVREYNIAVRAFPSNIIAGWFGFKEKTSFKATTPGAENAPIVEIGV